jgi:hypothetical protein
MSPGHDRKSYHVHGFLDRGLHDHFNGLVKSGVDNFHSCIFESMSYHFGASVMTVQTGFGKKYPRFTSHRRFNLRYVQV